MEIQTLISTFETVLNQHTGMGFFLDLLLKSLFVLLLLYCINLFTRGLAASQRHLVWCIGFIALFFLPFFIGFIPKIQVPINATVLVFNDTSVSEAEVAGLTDNINLALSFWWRFLAGVYLALAGLQLLYIALGLCKVFGLSRSAEWVRDTPAREELDNLILEEGLTVQVRLKQSREILSPVSWGLFRPEILLPVQAAQWDREKIRNVLIHELGHIQRLDWLTSLIVRCTRAVYWFNPLIWHAARKLDEEAEQACDDAVLLYGRCRNEYASNLLEIASTARLGHLGSLLVKAIDGSCLGSRVFSILDASRKRQKTEVVWVVRGILVTFTVIAILGSLRLVPLVNVASLAPKANTAFPVFFIPRDDGLYQDYMNEMYKWERDRQLPAGVLARDEGRAVLRDEPMDDDSGVERLGRRILITHGRDGRQVLANRGADAHYLAAQHAGDNQPVATAGDNRNATQPSLLDDYIAVTGMKSSKEIFDAEVIRYTNEILAGVEQGVHRQELAYLDEKASAGEPDDPVPIKVRTPDYPRRALSRGIEGYSVVEYGIDAAGRVVNPVIVDSSPGRIFNRSSLDAIREYSFEPPKRSGRGFKGLQTKFVYLLKPG